MKKLLCILGAVTIVASSGATIVSCGTIPSNDSRSAAINNENNLKLSMSEIAKALILNDKTGVDANYMFDNFVSTQRVQDIEGFDPMEGDITGYTRLNEWNKGYFNKASVIDKTTLKTNADLSVRKTMVTNSEGILQTIAGMGDAIKMLSQGNLLEAIVGIISNSTLLQAFITTDMADFIGSLSIPTDAVEELAYAFDDLDYVGYTYQEVINASSIELSNGLRNILGFTDIAEIQPNNETANFNQAADNISEMLMDIMGQGNTEINMLSSIRGLSQVIRFGRGLMAYILQFDSYREYTPKSGDKLFSEKTNNNNIVKEVLKTTFQQSDNEIDFKKVVVNLAHIFTVDENGYNFQKLIAMFFANNAGFLGIGGETSGFAPLINKMLVNIINSMMGESSGISSSLTLATADLFDAFANRRNLSLFITKINLAANAFPAEMKEKVNLVTSGLRASKLYNDIYGELYSGDFMKEIGNVLAPLGVNIGTSTGFNIRNLISTPMIDNKSISELLAAVSKELGVDPNKVAVDESGQYTGTYSEEKLNLAKVSKVIKALTKKVTWSYKKGNQISIITTSVLEKALKNPYNMFEIIEYNKGTGSFDAGSPLEAIKELLGKGIAIAEILQVLKVFAHPVDTSVNEEIKNIIQNELMVANNWKITNYNKKQSGIIIVEMSVNIKYQSDEYTLKAVRQKSGFFKLDTFNKVTR